VLTQHRCKLSSNQVTLSVVLVNLHMLLTSTTRPLDLSLLNIDPSGNTRMLLRTVPALSLTVASTPQVPPAADAMVLRASAPA
jgi:hypothetical protein